MRKYRLVFMEQRIGVSRLTPIAGSEVSFEAADDDAAQAHVLEHHMQGLQHCVRAELSSLAIVRDASGSIARLIDDSLENPHFQEFHLRYDPRSGQIEVDFDSTTTGLLPCKSSMM